MADIIKPDLCVIGAGALGIGLAVQARQRGLSVALLIRADDEAGDAPRGALRRAAFVATAARVQTLRTAGQLGLNAVEPKPNFRAITERATAIADAVTPRDSVERLTALGITILSGDAAFSDPQTLACGETIVRARQFALATGAYPLILDLPGLDQIPYFTPDTIGDNIRKLSHLVVIGGDAVALELAQAFRRLGATVTVVPQGGLLPGFDPELVAILVRALREEGVTILEGAAVSAIVPRRQGTGVTLRAQDGAEDSLDVSHVLVAMGRQPDLDGALLEKAKLRRDRLHADRLLVGPNGQTSSGRITAIGGAAAHYEDHVAQRQAALLIERLLGQSKGRLEPLQLPRFVHTQPPLAQLGLIGEGMPLRRGQTVLRANLAEQDAAGAVAEAYGVAKLVVDAKGDLIGGAVIGAGAGEMVAMLAMLAAHSLSIAELSRLALPQPSIAAALVELADQFQASQPRRGLLARLRR